MEEGSLRCDANVSVRRRGEERFGTKTEVKNLNSFRYLQRALEYEIERHIGVLESGGRIHQETRLWDVAEARTESMRSKEFAHDYRYFPDPDLLPVRVGTGWLAEIQRAMPETPAAAAWIRSTAFPTTMRACSPPRERSAITSKPSFAPAPRQKPRQAGFKPSFCAA